MEPKISRQEARRRVKAFLAQLGDHGWTLHVQHSDTNFFLDQKKPIAKEKSREASAP